MYSDFFAEKPRTEIQRTAVTRMLMQLFAHWKVSTEEQLAMLGLSRDNRASLSRYRKGSPIAPSRDVLDRAGHLLAIHKNLRLLFPKNRDMVYGWMTTPNKAFQGRTPAKLILDDGFLGLLMVRGYLDRARGQ